MRTPCLAAIALGLACAASSHGPAASSTPLTAAIAEAQRARRPLVVELGATWCKPCRAFADQVLVDPRVQAALRDVTFGQYDIDTPDGSDAMHRCNIAGVPAIVSLDRDGRVRASKVGAAPTVDEFLAFLRDAHAM